MRASGSEGEVPDQGRTAHGQGVCTVEQGQTARGAGGDRAAGGDRLAAAEGCSADWLAARVGEPSARGIAAVVAALIRRGDIATGVRLPTVRSLAAALGVSPGTVAEAWSILRRRHAISGASRRGTLVIGPPATPRPARFETIGHFGSRLALDLSRSVPDPRLLPPLERALLEGVRTHMLNDYERASITPRLLAAVAPTWPFQPADWLAVNGGFEGLLLAAQASIAAGDRVAIENPTAPRLLDILESLGARVLAVECDAEGPLPASLAAALERDPVVFMYQPRAQSPAGHRVSPARSTQLTAALEMAPEVLVVEDDGVGDVSLSKACSLGEHLPDRTVLVRSYSKSHGPDLRLAVVGGSAEVVDRMRALRLFGAGWSSRILQDALAFLLEDIDARRRVDDARGIYAERREALAAALREHGIQSPNRDGMSLWLPVADERSALVTLAAHGIAVSPGSRYFSGAAPGAHIRVSTGIAPADDQDWRGVAEVLATAAGA